MFTGQMKDLLVWDVALSPAQLDGVRLGGGLPSTPAPLISMMRTWCGAAPPPSPPPSQPPPPSPSPPSPPPYPPGTAVVSNTVALTSALANTAVGHIVVAPGTYYLTAELSITRSVVLEAAVAGSVVLHAQGSSSSKRGVLMINPGSSGVVQLIGLGITGGFRVGLGGGGGVAVWSGTVSILSCQIYSNSATNGGGVFVNAGTVAIVSTSISGNTTPDAGGAIYVHSGTVRLSSCSISGNTASLGPNVFVQNCCGAIVCSWATTLTGVIGIVSTCQAPPSPPSLPPPPPSLPPPPPPPPPDKAMDIGRIAGGVGGGLLLLAGLCGLAWKLRRMKATAQRSAIELPQGVVSPVRLLEAD
jgi:hypothetical protein